MTIHPLSGASWPVKQPAVEDAQRSHVPRRETPCFSSSCRGAPRQWELRKTASFPALEADDYWSDASLSLPRPVAALPQVEEKKRLPAAMSCSEHMGAHHRSRSLIREAAAMPKRARCADFPPPLDSPVHFLCEGRCCSLQTVEQVRFTSVRSNGRLIVTEMPIAAPPRLRLRVQREGGRLVIQLHVEGSPAEDRPLAAAEREEEETEEEAVPMENSQAFKAENPLVQAIKEAAKKADPALCSEGNHALCIEEEEEADEDGVDEATGSEAILYTKVPNAQGRGAIADADPVDLCSSIQSQCKYGRRRGVASFLHKSLTTVRPLHMLSIWQQTQALSLTEALHPCLLKG